MNPIRIYFTRNRGQPRKCRATIRQDPPCSFEQTTTVCLGQLETSQPPLGYEYLGKAYLFCQIILTAYQLTHII